MYTPQFEGPIEGWIMNFCRKHAWRVAASMEWDEIKQEAYIVYMRCVKNYPDVTEAPHFMALFKRAWINEFTDLAHKDTKLRCMVPFPTALVDDEVVEFEPMGELSSDGSLAVLLREAPKEVSMVLNLLLNAPTELVEVALSGWRGRDKRCRSGGSERLCRLLGLPKNMDVLQMVEDHFS